jgi:hypothetical protein
MLSCTGALIWNERFLNAFFRAPNIWKSPKKISDLHLGYSNSSHRFRRDTYLSVFSAEWPALPCRTIRMVQNGRISGASNYPRGGWCQCSVGGNRPRECFHCIIISPNYRPSVLLFNSDNHHRFDLSYTVTLKIALGIVWRRRIWRWLSSGL